MGWILALVRGGNFEPAVDYSYTFKEKRPTNYKYFLEGESHLAMSILYLVRIQFSTLDPSVLC